MHKKLAPRLFSLCLNGLCQIFRSIQSLVPKPLNVTWQNCANSTKVGSSLTFAGKIGKGLRLRMAIYRDSSFRGQRLRLSEIGFVTFWALYWTCFFLSSKEDFQKKKLYCLKIGIDRFQLHEGWLTLLVSTQF